MPDAADRIRPEVKPRVRAGAGARASSGAGKRAGARALALLKALAPKSKRGAAGAALVALMVGIVINAVALQHGKRADPLAEPAAVASIKPPAPAPVPAPAPAPAPTPTPAPVPPPEAPAHVEKAADPIAGLIAAPGGDRRKLTLAAQKALAGLGYKVKPTGALDAATKAALAKFAKKRKIAVPDEITARLVKKLTTAAADE